MNLAASLLRPRRRFRPHGAVLMAALVLGGIIVAAVLAGAFAPYPPRSATGTPVEAPSPSHRLGTNDLGQDLLSVWLHGARASLIVGFVTALLSTAAPGGDGLLSAAWGPGRGARLVPP